MATGRIHTKVSVATSFALIFSFPIVGFNSILLALGALNGVLVSPDLDVDNGYIGNFYLRKYLGRWADKLWGVYWYAYARLMPHRSTFSHKPFLGTLIRYVYMAPVIVISLSIGKHFLGQWYIGQLAFLVLGNIITDILHWIWDGMP